MLKVVLAVLVAVLLISVDIRSLQAAAFDDSSKSLNGEWELVGTCRNQRVKLTLKLYDYPNNEWGGIVYYWQWDGDKQGSIIDNWGVRGAMAPGSNSVTLSPQYFGWEESYMKRYGANSYNRHQIRFDWVSGAWRGKIADPSCDPVAFFDRPGPPKAVASTGMALSAAAWVGKSPMTIIGGQTLFDYSGMSPVPKDTGVGNGTVWTNVAVEKVRQSAVILNVVLESVLTIACPPSECGDPQASRVYSIFPGDSLHYAHRARSGVLEFCRFNAKRREWSCYESSRSLPPRESAGWAQWLWNNIQRLENAQSSGWKSRQSCRRVVEPCPLPDCPAREVCDSFRTRDVEACRRQCTARLADDMAARDQCSANCSR